MKEVLIEELNLTKEFFLRSTSCLVEEDSNYKPKDEMYTVANHYLHTAITIDWFIEGMFNPKGFDTNFEKQMSDAKACHSLKKAKESFEKAINNAVKIIKDTTDAELNQPLAKDTCMQGPRYTVIRSISEHTAHHRGALTVYSRLLGKTPKVPYGDI